MSPRTRAYFIGMLGPSLSAFALLAILASAALGYDTPDSFRQVVFEPAHLILLVGVLLSAATLPVAFAVHSASAEEVMPLVHDLAEESDAARADEHRGFEAAER